MHLGIVRFVSGPLKRPIDFLEDFLDLFEFDLTGFDHVRFRVRLFRVRPFWVRPFHPAPRKSNLRLIFFYNVHMLFYSSTSMCVCPCQSIIQFTNWSSIWHWISEGFFSFSFTLEKNKYNYGVLILRLTHPQGAYIVDHISLISLLNRLFYF